MWIENRHIQPKFHNREIQIQSFDHENLQKDQGFSLVLISFTNKGTKHVIIMTFLSFYRFDWTTSTTSAVISWTMCIPGQLTRWCCDSIIQQYSLEFLYSSFLLIIHILDTLFMYDDDKQIFEFIHNHSRKIWQWACFYFKKIVKKIPR